MQQIKLGDLSVKYQDTAVFLQFNDMVIAVYSRLEKNLYIRFIGHELNQTKDILNYVLAYFGYDIKIEDRRTEWYLNFGNWAITLREAYDTEGIHGIDGEFINCNQLN